MDQATRVVTYLHDSLHNIGTGTDRSVDERYALIAPVVSATHDLGYIARFVLRRYWKDLDAAQQQAFTERFSELSIMNYASRFAGFDRDAISITDARPISETRVQIEATLDVAPDDELTLSYTLQRDGGEWRIINVIADGVSDLAIRRSEYSRVLTDRGFAGLLDHVEQQTAGLR